jgi:hypothetical protein
VSQPKPRVAAPGGSTTFAVNATGTGPLTYQWHHNDAPIPNATSASYVIPAAAAGDLGKYHVVITNVVGEVISAPATLNFIDWLGTAGVFQGTFLRENGADAGETAPGRVTLTVAKNGRFSGKVENRGLAHAFKGLFDLDLHSQVEVKRRNDSSLTLKLDLSNTAGSMTAELTQSGLNDPAIADASRIPKRLRSQPAARAGRYTVHLKPGAESPSELKACGYLAVYVAPSGSVSWVGKMADTAVVKGSALLTSDDRIAFYSPLYVAKPTSAGHVAAPLAVTSAGVVGEIAWRRPAQVKGEFWRTELATILEVESSPWVAPRGALLLPPATLTFRLESAFSGVDETTVDFTTAGKFAFPLGNDKKLRLAVNRTTGVLTGSFYDSFFGRTRQMYGALLQNQGRGEGFAPGTTKIHEWEFFTPTP